ncbi:hypothetical protein [Kocuria sp. CNJ-770]|uniref:hypothetical protein n=1 Tax=Kocuria sp. CNJ-770 TaxID=1904964 RepID=UPI000A79E4E1
MSTPTSSHTAAAGEHQTGTQPPWAGPETQKSWWSGRSGLVVPAVVAAFSTYLLVGTLTMEIPEARTSPAPPSTR